MPKAPGLSQCQQQPCHPAHSQCQPGSDFKLPLTSRKLPASQPGPGDTGQGQCGDRASSIKATEGHSRQGTQVACWSRPCDTQGTPHLARAQASVQLCFCCSAHGRQQMATQGPGSPSPMGSLRWDSSLLASVWQNPAVSDLWRVVGERAVSHLLPTFQTAAAARLGPA